MICVPLLGRDPARRDRPIRTGRRDKPIIQLPSIALRVAVIVGIAAVMFGIVFFRLWFLQILSGQEFVAQANDNRLQVGQDRRAARQHRRPPRRSHRDDPRRPDGRDPPHGRARGHARRGARPARAASQDEARRAAQAHQGLPAAEHDRAQGRGGRRRPQRGGGRVGHPRRWRRRRRRRRDGDGDARPPEGRFAGRPDRAHAGRLRRHVHRDRRDRCLPLPGDASGRSRRGRDDVGREHGHAEEVGQLPDLGRVVDKRHHRRRPDPPQGGREQADHGPTRGAHAVVPRRRGPGRVPALVSAGRHGRARPRPRRPISAEELETQALQGLRGRRRRRSGRAGVDLRQVAARPRRRRQGRGRRARVTPSRAPSVPGGRMAETGDTLVTTIDSKVQAAAEQALRTGISLAHTRRPVRRQRRCGRRARRQERRRARHGELPDLRPEASGSAGIKEKSVQAAAEEERQLPAAQPRDPGEQGGGLDLQGRDGRRRAGGGRDHVRARPSGAPARTPRPTTTRSLRRSSSAGRPTATATSTSSARSRSPATSTSTTSATRSTSARGPRWRTGPCASAWARPTGIDIPGESAGRVPTPDWKQEALRDGDRQAVDARRFDPPRRRAGQPRGDAAAARDDLRGDRQRRQGRDAASGAQGRRRRRADRARPGAARRLARSTSRRPRSTSVRQGLYEAAHNPAGTSAPIFSGYKVAVAGKTGTAEVWDESAHRIRQLRLVRELRARPTTRSTWSSS